MARKRLTFGYEWIAHDHAPREARYGQGIDRGEQTIAELLSDRALDCRGDDLAFGELKNEGRAHLIVGAAGAVAAEAAAGDRNDRLPVPFRRGYPAAPSSLLGRLRRRASSTLSPSITRAHR